MSNGNLTVNSITKRVIDQIGDVGIKTKKAISVTFDDGYTSQFDHTFDLLEDIGIRATYFITSWQDGRRKNDGGNWMSESKIKQLSNHGHEIGDHSTTHTPNVSLEQLTEEWRIGTAYLESITGKQVFTHAYPYGRWGIHFNRRAQGFFEGTRGGGNGVRDSLYNTHAVNIDEFSVNESKQLVDDFLNGDGGHLVVYIHQIYPDDEIEEATRVGRPTEGMLREVFEYMNQKRMEGLVDIIPYYQGIRRLEPMITNTYK